MKRILIIIVAIFLLILAINGLIWASHADSYFRIPIVVTSIFYIMMFLAMIVIFSNKNPN